MTEVKSQTSEVTKNIPDETMLNLYNVGLEAKTDEEWIQLLQLWKSEIRNFLLRLAFCALPFAILALCALPSRLAAAA